MGKTKWYFSTKLDNGYIVEFEHWLDSSIENPCSFNMDKFNEFIANLEVDTNNAVEATENMTKAQIYRMLDLAGYKVLKRHKKIYEKEGYSNAEILLAVHGKCYKI